ncbi:MAG: GyrI-like domain-containing protein [Salinivirgaceae bacterium]
MILSDYFFIPMVVFIVFVALVAGFFLFHRVLHKIAIREIKFQPFNFVYKSYRGDYAKNGAMLEGMVEQLKAADVPIVNMGVIYHDNPRKTPKKELRSDVGFMVPETVGANRVPELNVKTIKHNDYLASSFPYKSRFSIAIGAMKVYKAFNKELKKRQKTEREIIEIYDMQNRTIVYLMPME